MDLTCDERPSDSPFIERVWQSQGEGSAVSFLSMAEIHSGIVVTKYRGSTILTVRGPETRATPAYSHAEAEIFGIQFKAGAFMPNLPPQLVMDRHDLNLPDASSKSFWLKSAAWQFPDFENVDTFVDRLVHEDLLAYDPAVDEILNGHPVPMSLRTVQRRFLQATGLTQKTMQQIERARAATSFLKQGIPIMEAVHQCGYFDQAHLTRSLKRFTGLTPSQIIDQNRLENLSFLYNTDFLRQITMPLSMDKDEENNLIQSVYTHPGQQHGTSAFHPNPA